MQYETCFDQIIDKYSASLEALEKQYSKDLKDALAVFENKYPEFPAISVKESVDELVVSKYDEMRDDPKSLIKDFEVYLNMANRIRYFLSDPEELAAYCAQD